MHPENQRLAILLEMNFKRVFKEISELREQVQELQRKLSLLAPKPEAAIQQETKVLQQAPASQEEFSQRTGNYTPEDVALEKFFYAGKR
ncbi:hypothetical protein DRJ48_05580 [Candidatus Woesearchaeota archaeon]|nr:MAG: hypothetical protein DRJ48_05580 [Candidatus Woesearchaeota archaeon]